MEMNRASGILVHPTSFPSPHGIGDLGAAAYQFIDFLVAAKQSLWQILPLGPTGYGDSPYASFSTFAGNPLLISVTKLMEAGDLSAADLASAPSFPNGRINYGWVIQWKVPLLEKAARHFMNHASPERKADYDDFCQKQALWLDDFALFVAVKEEFDRKAQEEGVSGAMWSSYWPKNIRLREAEALAYWREQKAESIAVKKIIQFYFFQQWGELRRYANERGIKIMGDVPIFVASDSVDAWANRELFLMDKDGRQTAMAGVPPDYFSVTGQLWGNPLYDWKAMEKDGFKWWINRVKAMLGLVDIVRIDHFRGFEGYWEVPAGSETAIGGKWVKAPGQKLFQKIKEVLGELPIVAEDLGVITPEVRALRDNFHFPGMKILQFAFDAKESGGINSNNAFLPHNHVPNCVVYTGTHDNDTTLGWYLQRSEEEKNAIRQYIGRPDQDIVWEFIRLAMASVGNWAIIPMQDLLKLDNHARMNTPSVLGGNWSWRYQVHELTHDHVEMLRHLTALFGRVPLVEEV